MDLGKLLDNAAASKSKGKSNGKPPQSPAIVPTTTPAKKVTTTPLSVFNPTPSAAPNGSKAANGTTHSKVSKAPATPQVEFNTDDYIGYDDSERLIILRQLLDKQLLEESTRFAANYKLAKIIQCCGLQSEDGHIILSYLHTNLPSQASLKHREATLSFLNYLFSLPTKINSLNNGLENEGLLLSSYGKLLEPYLVPFLSTFFLNHADRSTIIRDQSTTVILKMSGFISPHSFRLIYPFLLSGMSEEDWRVKVGTLTFLKALAPRVSRQLSPLLPELIPAISECIYDSKRQVQLMGIDTMNEACKVITNDDIRPIVPSLVSVIANPDESAKTLDLLLETTFVQNVDASVLALLAPLLGKALRGRSSVLKRKASKVIDIMCKLVQDPAHVKPFEPLLLPALNRVIDEIVDAEVCDVAKAARHGLLKALGDSHSIAASKLNSNQSLNNLQQTTGAGGGGMHRSGSKSNYQSLSNLQDKLEQINIADLNRDLLQKQNSAASVTSQSSMHNNTSMSIAATSVTDDSGGDNNDYGNNESSSSNNDGNENEDNSVIGSVEETVGTTAIASATVQMASLFESPYVQTKIFQSVLSTILPQLKIPTVTAASVTSDTSNTAVTVTSVTSATSNGIEAKYNQISLEYISQLLTYLSLYSTTLNPAMPLSDLNTAVSGDDYPYTIAMTDIHEWRDCIYPYLSAIFPLYMKIPDIQTTATTKTTADDSNGHSNKDEIKYHKYYIHLTDELRIHALNGIADAQHDDDTDDTSLCNIEFSLAFGGKILLQNTFLKLGKGKRYGVVAKNGSGKTTLLTNIGLGTIEGLPSHLKTIYVQHDDATEDHGVCVIDELIMAKVVQDANVTREQALFALREISFTDEMIHSPRSSLSGGWKMKLLIIRAMLSRANVLLLDEPTNHLDKASVAWLTKYLQNAHDVTCLIVTHDTQFLDDVCTDIIHYENKKLVYYHGNLTHFVKIHPEAKYYYELATSTLSFKFPAPERLEGINSNTKSIMKMDNITYTYPGKNEPQLKSVSVRVCLGSRIAVLGANGAGKSTLIKLLVQETEPDVGSGEVWKHMNLRIAYVAQHSFHHVEKHLDASPCDYIKWRFYGGVDRESLERPTMKLTEEEVVEKKGDRRFGDVDQVLGRRKNGRTMEYECTFIGQTSRDPNKYIAVEQMIEMGHAKLVAQCDARVAAMAAGLDLRPLIISEIQGHLNDFNLEAEFGTHGTIKRLSGGQKVKLVLAAAMWNKPHVIVLDEPTNYLDREALGALTTAIKQFAGGVVIISHNSEFTQALCTETWLVQDGKCYTEGEALENNNTSGNSGVKKSKSVQGMKEDEADTGGAGNMNKTISSEVILNPKTLESLSKKEVRKLERLAIVAGMSLKEYVSKINSKSPEWKWL